MKFYVTTDWSDGVPREVGCFTTDEGKRLDRVELEKMGRLFLAAQELLDACRCALADMEGIMPEFDNDHPGWKTILELQDAITKAERKDE